MVQMQKSESGARETNGRHGGPPATQPPPPKHPIVCQVTMLDGQRVNFTVDVSLAGSIVFGLFRLFYAGYPKSLKLFRS